MSDGDTGRLTVFWWDLEVDDELTQRLGRLLDSQERNRAERFITLDLQRRFVVAHGALRLILASVAGAPPEALVFERGPFGKPKLAASNSAASRRYFNFSHSAGVACVAVSASDGVGVDVECERPVPDAPQLLTAILNPPELAVAMPTPEASLSDPGQILRKCWTMKEAVLKASGYGLSVDPRDVLLAPSGLNAVLHGEQRTRPAPCEAAIISSAHSWSGQVQPFVLPAGCGAVATTAPNQASDLELVNLPESTLRELFRGTACSSSGASAHQAR